MAKVATDFRLSKHAYQRFLERITYLEFREAEEFINKEIFDCRITKTEDSMEDGMSKTSYICEEIKYIVKNNVVLTVHTLY